MRSCETALILCAWVIPLFAQGDRREQVKREKVENAAMLAVEQSISSLRKQLRTPEQLAAVMLGNAPAHAHADASRPPLRAESPVA